MGLPVILERNNLTMPQERYNTDWVQEHEVGVVIREFRRIADAARFLLENGRLERFRENARRLNNRANGVWRVANDNSPATSFFGKNRTLPPCLELDKRKVDDIERLPFLVRTQSCGRKAGRIPSRT